MEKVKRWLWRTKFQIYFFFKRLIREIRLEHDARRYSKDKTSRKLFKEDRRRIRRFSELTPEEQSWWLEEERLKWEDYYDSLL